MAGIKTRVSDIGKAFNTIKDEMFTKYRGCLIENLSNKKFRWGGEIYDTLSEAKQAIDSNLDSLIDKLYNNGNKKESTSKAE